MQIEIPVDLPVASLSNQLTWVAQWANVDVNLFLHQRAEIAAVFFDTKRLNAILRQCCPKEIWSWPAYEELIQRLIAYRNAEEEDDGEPFTANDIRIFDVDAVRDMVSHIANKLLTNHRAIYRKGQMEEVLHLRPFWQLKSSDNFVAQRGCNGLENQTIRTYLADDPIWKNEGFPWNCIRFCCECRVNSLSRTELQRYVETGCSPGDEGAVDILKFARLDSVI